MPAGQQFAQAASSIIPELQQYIDSLLQKYGGQQEMAPTITALGDELYALENLQLQQEDDSPQMKNAVLDLKNANASIASEIKSVKQVQDSVEQAAQIIAIIQGAIKLATAIV
jgi:hypothetical protein